MWNFLRVEKEHIANCGSFKAVDDIKLPYEHVTFLTDEHNIFKQELINHQEKGDDTGLNIQIFQEKSGIKEEDIKLGKYPSLSMNRNISFAQSKRMDSRQSTLTEPLIMKHLKEENEMSAVKTAEMDERDEDDEEYDDDNGLQMFRKASHLQMGKEDLHLYKKDPFPFDEWLAEVAEFKKNVVDRLSNNFRVMEKTEALTIHAKRNLKKDDSDPMPSVTVNGK
jgi:hypothetical protein